MTPIIRTVYPALPVRHAYDVPYGCANCGWSRKQHFDRGKAAPSVVECPKCGCRTANKQVAPPHAPRRLDEREYLPLPRPIDVPQPWWPKRPWPHDPRPRWTPYCDVVNDLGD